nr:zinc finger protein 32 isoform X3 [Rattus norvegicus]
MGIAAPTHMTALPSNQNQPAPGQRSWFLPRHRGDASHSASRHAQAPGSCGPATRSIAAAATGSTPALSVCGRAPLRYSSPAHGSIIRRGGDQSHRAGADMFGFPTATLLDCHGRYAQNVAFFSFLCTPGYSGTHFVDQADPELTETCLPLPPEHWTQRCKPPPPGL